MSYASILQDLPPELQLTMFKLVEALEQNMRAQFAVRREDFLDLSAQVNGLLEAQQASVQRADRLGNILTGLAEAQQATEVGLGRLETAVARLAEAQQATEVGLGRLETAVARLAEAQQATEQRVGELAEAQKRAELQLIELAHSNKEIRNELSKIRGDRLERQYRERGFAYLGQILRRVRSVSLQDILNSLEGHLTDEEIAELLPLDLLMQGQAFQLPNKPNIWLALEISGVVDRNDVERVLRRTALLRKAGYVTIPAVAGEKVTEGGEELARSSHVFVLQNGHKLFWEDALTNALARA